MVRGRHFGHCWKYHLPKVSHKFYIKVMQMTWCDVWCHFLLEKVRVHWKIRWYLRLSYPRPPFRAPKLSHDKSFIYFSLLWFLIFCNHKSLLSPNWTLISASRKKKRWPRVQMPMTTSKSEKRKWRKLNATSVWIWKNVLHCHAVIVPVTVCPALMLWHITCLKTTWVHFMFC